MDNHKSAVSQKVMVHLTFPQTNEPFIFRNLKNSNFALTSLYAMAILVMEFSNGGYKIRKFLTKNQHTKRKLLKFEFGINGKLTANPSL